MLMYGFISIQAHLNTTGSNVGDLLRMLQRYNLIRAGSTYCLSIHTNAGNVKSLVLSVFLVVKGEQKGNHQGFLSSTTSRKLIRQKSIFRTLFTFLL